jgi:hypothetical protein
MTVPPCLEAADRQVTDDQEHEASGNCGSRDAASELLHEQISRVPASMLAPYKRPVVAWWPSIATSGGETRIDFACPARM